MRMPELTVLRREFYQLDMELAFSQARRMYFAVLKMCFRRSSQNTEFYNEASKPPFKRIPYLEAMDKYGSDKPDLRINLLVQDATDVLADCGFGPFEGKKVKSNRGTGIYWHQKSD